MRYVEGIMRYGDPYSIEPPEWATDLAISTEEWNVVHDVGTCWWFINPAEGKWSHYNSSELFGNNFTGFSPDAVEIHPLKVSLENK